MKNKEQPLRDISKIKDTSVFTRSIESNPSPELPVIAATIVTKWFGRHYLISTICINSEYSSGAIEAIDKLGRSLEEITSHQNKTKESSFVTQAFYCDKNGHVRSFKSPLYHVESSELRSARILHSLAVSRFVHNFL